MSNTIRNLLVKTGVDLTGLQKGFKQAAREMKAAGKEMTAAGKSLTMGITAPLLAVGGIAVKSAIDFESAFAGVRKTVNATEEELEGIKQGIIDMSLEIPSTTEEISKVAEAAGQLGIKSKDILSFSRVMIDLGNTTNLSADQAATELARLANITGMLPENYSRLGSTIVALGNNMATTEAEISSMSLRLAGAGKQVGMTEPQIMGLAAALSSVGIEAEAGGSAMSKVMVDMQLAVSQGGSALEDFAAVAGMSADEFKTAFQRDAVGALTSFIKGLSTSKDRGMDAIVVLDKMGITEVRMRDALLRAASAGDLFNTAIKLGVDAWEENTAMTKEAGERYKTTESQLKILKNQVMEVARQLGNALMPVLKDAIIPAIQWFAGVIADVVKWFQSLSPQMQQVIGLVAGLAVAMGPLLTVTGKIVTSLSAVTKGIGLATQALSAGKGLMGAMSAFLGPAGMVAAAIAAITLVVGLLTIAMGDFGKEAQKIADGIKNLIDECEQSAKAFEDQTEEINASVSVQKKLTDELYSLAAQEKKTNTEKARMKQLVSQLNDMIPDLNLAIDETTGALNLEKSAIDNLIAAKEKEIKLKAYEDRLVELYKEQVRIQEELTAANQRYNSVQEDVNKNIGLAITNFGSFGNLTGTAKSQVDQLTEAQSKNNAAIAAAEASYGTMAATVVETSTTMVNSNNLVKTSNDELILSEDEKVKALEEQAKKIEDMTNTHLSEMGTIYDKGISQRKVDTDDVITNLKKQVSQFQKWRNNIKTLSASVPSDVMAELIKLGPEAAPLIADLVKQGDPKLQEFVDLMRRKNKLAREAAIEDEALGGLPGNVESVVTDTTTALENKTTVEEAAKAIGQSASQKAKEGITSEKTNLVRSATGIGESIIDGLKTGMNNKTGSLYDRAREIARKVLSEMKSVIQPGSPSKVTTAFGKAIADGLTLGIGQGAADAIRQARSLAAGLTGTFENIGAARLQVPNFAGASSANVSLGMAESPVMSTSHIYDAFSKALREHGGSNRPVILYLNGREFARATVDDISHEMEIKKTGYSRAGGRK